MDYQEPELSDDERKFAITMANKLNYFVMGKRFTYFIALIIENMTLLKEVNDHRARLGIELKPVYNIKKMNL